MRIAIAFKENDEILEKELHILKLNNFEISSTSNKYTYWIYDLKNVLYFGSYIIISRQDLTSQKIYIQDIEYFEVH